MIVIIMMVITEMTRDDGNSDETVTMMIMTETMMTDHDGGHNRE